MFYPEALTLYMDRGWDTLTSVIPLPEARKKAPPIGYTGRAPKHATDETYSLWRASFERGNTALVMPDGYIGIDIDTYGEKQGWNRWFDFWDERGVDCNEIDMKCWISSARGDPKNSGIRWFKVPTGFDWESWLGGTDSNIEIVRPGHRYAVVFPSIHPDTGETYRWYRPGNLETPADPPRPEDIVYVMPDALQAKLRKGRRSEEEEHVETVGWDAAEQWLTERRNEDLCDHMEKELLAAITAVESGSAYDMMVVKVSSLIHLAAEGCSGIIQSLNSLYHVYTDATPNRAGTYTQRDITREWQRSVAGAISKTEISLESCAFKEPAPEIVAPFTVKTGNRSLTLTSAGDIPMKRVRWLWKERIAMGTLSLVAGQAGLGKSTLVYWLVAQLTVGKLYGEFEGIPKSVIICATEDSWSHTIVPRLVAAGADRRRVFRVDVESENDSEDLNLVKDKDALALLAREEDVALLVLDPLTSRLGDQDTHKDSDVRKALEPMVRVAEGAGFSIVGIMHHNKAEHSGALKSVMGSTAFGAVARSVHTVVMEPTDPDDEDDSTERRIFGTVKNNLGRKSGPGFGLDTWAFKIDTATFDTEDDDPKQLSAGKLVWDGDVDNTVDDIMALAGSAHREREPRTEGKVLSKKDKAIEFLADLFDKVGTAIPRSQVLGASEFGFGLHGSHTEDALKRALKDKQFDYHHAWDAEARVRVTYWGLRDQIAEMKKANDG